MLILLKYVIRHWGNSNSEDLLCALTGPTLFKVVRLRQVIFAASTFGIELSGNVCRYVELIRAGLNNNVECKICSSYQFLFCFVQCSPTKQCTFFYLCVLEN